MNNDSLREKKTQIQLKTENNPEKKIVRPDTVD